MKWMFENPHFSGLGKIVDVGGGRGSLVAAILKTHPQMSAILFDLAPVIESATDFIGAQGLESRCELVSGDFFDSVPGGADAYILKHIIHNWENDSAIAILKNCRRAMTGTARLLLVEMVIPPGNESSLGKLSDINMLVMQGGFERTQAEHEALLRVAGFKLEKIISTQSLFFHMIEGIPE